MAKKTVLVSDKSGKEVEERDYARVTIAFTDRRRGRWEADLSVDEVTELFGDYATRKGAVGRPPAEDKNGKS